MRTLRSFLLIGFLFALGVFAGEIAAKSGAGQLMLFNDAGKVVGALAAIVFLATCYGTFDACTLRRSVRLEGLKVAAFPLGIIAVWGAEPETPLHPLAWVCLAVVLLLLFKKLLWPQWVVGDRLVKSRPF